MIIYKGLPGPVICNYWAREYSAQFYEEGTSFHIGKIKMVANTGTYLDTPFHRYEDGQVAGQKRGDILTFICYDLPYEKMIIDICW